MAARASGPRFDSSGSIGPVGDFSSLTEVSKLMMILWMLLGRLELMPILVMLSPGTWKER